MYRIEPILYSERPLCKDGTELFPDPCKQYVLRKTTANTSQFDHHKSVKRCDTPKVGWEVLHMNQKTYCKRESAAMWHQCKVHFVPDYDTSFNDKENTTIGQYIEYTYPVESGVSKKSRAAQRIRVSINAVIKHLMF